VSRADQVKSSRQYEDLLENLSEQCKGRIEGFEAIHEQLVRHRVESEHLASEKPIEEHAKLTH